MNNDLDIWHVRLSNGETRALSLDALDQAFQEGWVNEHTPVLPAGAITWQTLGHAAGLDATPAPVEAMPNSIAPLALDASAEDLAADPDFARLAPKRGRAAGAVLAALLLLVAVGTGGVYGRPALGRALGSSSKVDAEAQAKAAKAQAKADEEARAAHAKAEADARAASAASAASAAQAKADAEAQAAQAKASSVPTLSPSALPDADAKSANAKKTKRAAPKRR